MRSGIAAFDANGANEAMPQANEWARRLGGAIELLRNSAGAGRGS